MALVVDSSVVTKWIIPEVDSAEALRLFDVSYGPLVVLDLALIEVTNAIFVRRLRGKIDDDEAIAAFHSLSKIGAEQVVALDLLPRGFEIAIQYRDSIPMRGLRRSVCDARRATQLRERDRGRKIASSSRSRFSHD